MANRSRYDAKDGFGTIGSAHIMLSDIQYSGWYVMPFLHFAICPLLCGCDCNGLIGTLDACILLPIHNPRSIISTPVACRDGI